MTTTPPNPPWVIKKAVVVSIPDSEVACSASLRIFHDGNTDKGSISLKIKADLANLRGVLQDLTLTILPERVDECALSLTNNDGLCSPRLVSMLRASVPNIAAVSTLSLTLGTTGVVLVPRGMERLSPADPQDMNFYAFAKICQSKSLRLHFANRQFVDDQIDRLKTFSLALHRKDLEAESFKHPLSGVDERDWTVFDLSPDPPPYYEPVLKPVIGKHERDQWTLEPNDKKRKRLFSSPSSSGTVAEIMPPSTCFPAPSSIRPASFARAISPGCNGDRLARLEHELRGMPDDLVRKLLSRAGHGHLLARPEVVNSDLPSYSGPADVELADVKQLERPLKEYIDQMIERRLPRVVDERIDCRFSRLVHELVDNAVSDGRDQIFDDCKINEAEFREQVDDGNSEVRLTANECMKEIQEQAQRHVEEIEEHAQQCMEDLENQGFAVKVSLGEKVAELKRRWFNASAPSSLAGRTSPGHELGSLHVRRSSF
ncbi:uncharacterized protein BP01DRAFT_388291 [Aspergillus saccharolyticus JOP 1030-1]|uniref:Uncharacterized protein n=1 Tax=Aspergillus saccharolyticus JOP 1030-1 TaxID=1450539 RepID=A0A318ZNP1_9EURO|nr:hypothetical protein BP01DRAFT_388291 [Aspergillus saccharolyticus JOP 1030-1]PYH49219.1 hypothetical protein BP01DRAFT_388291 [Aspergillus saccharolyticus JOP 1030-1]